MARERSFPQETIETTWDRQNILRGHSFLQERDMHQGIDHTCPETARALHTTYPQVAVHVQPTLCTRVLGVQSTAVQNRQPHQNTDAPVHTPRG